MFFRRSSSSSAAAAAARLFCSTTSPPKPISHTIRSLRRERNLDAFLSRFNLYSSTSPRFRSDASIYIHAVQRLAAAGRLSDVTAVVDALRPQTPDDPTASTYTSRMIALYGKVGMHDRALETFRQLPRSTRSFNALLSALQSTHVVDAFNSIPTEHSDVVPDVHSYTIVIKCLCEKGDFEAAVGILNSMEAKGVEPNAVTFTSLLDVLYRNDRYEEAEKIWGIMAEKGCQDARSFNSKLRWLVKNDKTPEAVKVFAEMGSQGLKPDGHGMGALIVGHCKEGKLKEAKKLYWEIRRQNCPREGSMYEALIPMVRQAGELNFALNLCHESVKNRWFVSAQVLQEVLDDLAKASKFDGATHLYAAAQASRHYPQGSLKKPHPCITWQREQKQKEKVVQQEKEKVVMEQEKEKVVMEQEMEKNDLLEQINDDTKQEQSEQEKRAYAKIGIIVKSFDKPNYLGAFGIPLDKNRVKLPSTRSLITVLRSPHIDKKSREQFEMKVRREYLVIKCQPHELQKKYFWFKRTRILGAQFELVFSYKTRLDMNRLRSPES